MYSKGNIIIIGIGGCSRSGKTMLVNELYHQYKILKKLNNFSDVCDIMHLDDYASHIKVMQNKVTTSKGNIYGNWEFPGSLEWDSFYNNIKLKIKKMNSILENNPANKGKKGILFIEGFLIFSPVKSKFLNENDYFNLIDIFIFTSLDKKIAKIRRMKTTAVPEDYYEEILWPEYVKNCTKYIKLFQEQKLKNNKDVLVIDGNMEYNINKVATCILKWINVAIVNNILDINLYNDIFIPFNEQIYLMEKSFDSY